MKAVQKGHPAFAEVWHCRKSNGLHGVAQPLVSFFRWEAARFRRERRLKCWQIARTISYMIRNKVSRILHYSSMYPTLQNMDLLLAEIAKHI